MKKVILTLSIVGAVACSYAQGTVNFVNGATTLISAGGVSTPSRAVSTFYYAVFLAPSTTALAAGQSASLTAPAFQVVGGTNINHATAAGALTARTGVDVGTSSGGLGAGSTVDFIVRGWSANAGATWSEALAFWNNGSPSANMYIGTSTIGNDIVLGGGAIANTQLFGVGAQQVGGFNMALVPAAVVPEPSSLVLAGLGAASLLAFRRRN